ncbi:MAG: hypothetical protein ACR2LL_04065 [Nitrosopumilus sp.]
MKSVLVLLGLAFLSTTIIPLVFTDKSEITIETVLGSGTSGCETTAEGCYTPSTAIVDVGVVVSNTDTLL